MEDDTLLKFVFRAGPVRGEIVRLSESWRQIGGRHRLPGAVQRLLGESTAAAALLASTIKFNGALLLQIHGDGPVSLLVVECQPNLALRATAKLREAVVIAESAGLPELVNATGRGRCAITLDPRAQLPGQQAYQGIVPLEGDSIAQALQSYLLRSEQLESRLWLAADANCAAGLLLQRLPHAQVTQAQACGEDDDLWERAGALASTLTPEELLATRPSELLHRLFWQEPNDRFAPMQPHFACTCTRERIAGMLRSLGREEVDSIVAEQGQCSVTCDFCSTTHVFDAVDAATLFSPAAQAAPGLH